MAAPETLVSPEMATPDPTSPSATLVVRAPLPAAPVLAEPASIQLIFTDGSVVPLPEDTRYGRQAQYLARRVLEAGQRS
jgi:hypothetical protein